MALCRLSRHAGKAVDRPLSIPLQRGRLIDARDVRDAPPVAVVSEVFAQRFWRSWLRGEKWLSSAFRLRTGERWLSLASASASSRKMAVRSFRDRRAEPTKLVAIVR